MGGIVGLTIRFSKTEYRGSCWTNVLTNGLFAAPFYADLDASKRHVQAWLKRILDHRQANPDVEDIWGGHNLLAPVEYGIVIVDYVTSTLVSCQGYSSPFEVHCFDGRDSDKWDALERAGLLTRIATDQHGWKNANVKIPFLHSRSGFEHECDRALQAWCEENFGLSDKERAAWAEWYKRFEEDT